MAEVKSEQFTWDGDSLIHMPTGARFNRKSSFVNYGKAGETLADGSCFERGEVVAVAHQIVLESNTKREV